MRVFVGSARPPCSRWLVQYPHPPGVHQTNHQFNALFDSAAAPPAATHCGGVFCRALERPMRGRAGPRAPQDIRTKSSVYLLLFPFSLQGFSAPPPPPPPPPSPSIGPGGDCGCWGSLGEPRVGKVERPATPRRLHFGQITPGPGPAGPAKGRGWGGCGVTGLLDPRRGGVGRGSVSRRAATPHRTSATPDRRGAL